MTPISIFESLPELQLTFQKSRLHTRNGRSDDQIRHINLLAMEAKMDTKEKLFAFKVAPKDQGVDSKENESKWVAREGVAAAGCTDYKFPGNVRYPSSAGVADQGIYC